MSNGILIADDSATARKVIRAYLNQRNFEVCGEAIDGVDALEKATELEPALILLDLRMPRMNGLEAASVLRGRMPNVRIVLLTLYDEFLSYKSLMSAIGIDEIISKPNGFSRLAECVRGLLGSPPVPSGAKPKNAGSCRPRRGTRNETRGRGAE
jgi:DNA-binding NarL/FixJ family response regulator